MKDTPYHAHEKLDPFSPEPKVDQTDFTWFAYRKPQAQTSSLLEADTFSWLLGLPQPVRPMQLGWQFPRIANQLASIWEVPAECWKYFDELLTSKRQGRRGFPTEIACEIMRLREYFGQMHQ